MKKYILITLILLFSVFLLSDNINAANCSYDWWTISDSIDSCLWWTDLVDSAWDMSIELDFKTKILDWITKIVWFLWLIAVWSLVYASFMMTISWWEEEKIKKAKDIIKWSLLWFLWIVLAWSLITLIVNFMYSLDKLN